MAKGHKTGGRKKGVPNKRTATLAQSIASTGLTPLDYMLNVMRDEAAPRHRRDDMAKSAAPYIHSKMPTALVTPPRQNTNLDTDDKSLIEAYLHGLHDDGDD